MKNIRIFFSPKFTDINIDMSFNSFTNTDISILCVVWKQPWRSIFVEPSNLCIVIWDFWCVLDKTKMFNKKWETNCKFCSVSFYSSILVPPNPQAVTFRNMWYRKGYTMSISWLIFPSRILHSDIDAYCWPPVYRDKTKTKILSEKQIMCYILLVKLF